MKKKGLENANDGTWLDQLRDKSGEGKGLARILGIIFVLIILYLLVLQADSSLVKAAEDANVGFQDMEYKTSGVSEPTAQKPQSKLWYNDGKWWGDFYSKDNGAYHIYVLDWQTQVWSDTGVALDDRENSWADTLWDGTHLYVASGTSGGPGKLYRYTYDANPADGKPYKLSPGFPVEVTSHGMEAIVLTKDGLGKLWITYTRSNKVYVAHSDGVDSTWITPYVLPVAEASGLWSDDISSIVAYDGHIGVMWSNQTLSKMVFAALANGVGDDQWQVVSAYTLSADDHINLKSLQADSAGNVFAVVKTSFSNVGQPGIVLLACTGGDCKSAVNWGAYTVYARTSNSQRTRPILLLDTENREVYVFMATSGGGPIRYKKSSYDALSFPADGEEIFIDYGGGINDPTSTKQNLTSVTGLVVAASDGTYYYHNCLNLTQIAECPDPNPSPRLEFAISNDEANENGGSATIEVKRSGNQNDVVTVDYHTSDGTATAGSDYVPASDTLTFGAGETSRTFTVNINNDGLDEPDETVFLTLSNPTNVSNPGNGAELGPTSSSTLTIKDDEEPSAQFTLANYEVDEGVSAATIAVMLDIPSILPINVDFMTQDGTAVADSDYTPVSGVLSFAPGETSKSFEVPILEDVEDESKETVDLILKGEGESILDQATLTILDNEPLPLVQFEEADVSVSEDVGEATLFVTLSKASGDEVTVIYETTNEGTATDGADFLSKSSTLIFAPGETRKSFTVTIFDNGASESSETVSLKLRDPQEAEIGTPNTALLTILDDDIEPEARFSNSSMIVNEGSGTVVVTVELSDASAKPITVDYDVEGITAVPGGDFEVDAGTLTFDPGLTSQSFSLNILEDDGQEMIESFQLTLNGTNNAAVGEPQNLQVYIIDNDSTHIYLPFVRARL